MKEVLELNDDQLDLCHRTISAYTFFLIVGDALAAQKPLSVVRMGDGEQFLMDACKSVRWYRKKTLVQGPGGDKEWLRRLGIDGIQYDELEDRLTRAARNCTYFAPSLAGVQRPNFDLYQYWPRKQYVDNFFVNIWDDEQKAALFRAAKHVLLIHSNSHTADSMQLRVQSNLDAKVSWLKLDRWDQTEDVIKEASRSSAPLVLFSAGPAGKYIASEISSGGRIPKVVLDLGNAADHWTMDSLPADRDKADAFHRKWSVTNL